MVNKVMSWTGRTRCNGNMVRRADLCLPNSVCLFVQACLAAGRDLLQQTAISITRFALACGFSSASHFNRAYREAFRITPASERRV